MTLREVLRQSASAGHASHPDTAIPARYHANDRAAQPAAIIHDLRELPNCYSASSKANRQVHVTFLSVVGLCRPRSQASSGGYVKTSHRMRMQTR